MSEPPRLDRDQLAALQTLYVHLLFRHDTLNAYAEDAARTLEQYGLPASVKTLLPDPSDDGFLAEVRGRRMLVVREVAKYFERTAAFFESLGRSPRPAVAPLSFDAFLSSKYFLDPMNSLPHPNGIGPGFESISKFFLWMRKEYGTDRPGAHLPLRMALNTDFAVYLMGIRQRPAHPYYDRFKGGVLWSETPGAPVPVHFVGEQLLIAKITSPEKRDALLAIGIVDLDTLAPEPWELEPAI